MSYEDMESQLRQAFNVTADQVPADIGVRLRARDYQPRSYRRPVTASVAASALLVGGGGAIVALGTGPAAQVAGPSPSAPAPAPVVAAAPTTTRTTTTAPVPLPVKTVHLTRLQLAAAAIADVSGDLFHVTTTSPDGWTGEDWITADGNTLLVTSHDPSGTHAEDMLVKNAGTVQTTVDVDYTKKTYWNLTGTVPTPPANCQPPSCLDEANGGIIPGKYLGGAPLTTDGVKWLLGHGAHISATTVTPAGTYALVYAASPNVDETLVMDSVTNLPTKVTYSQGSKEFLSSSVEWLDPTDANLAKLDVTVPDGYTQVPPLGSYPSLAS